LIETEPAAPSASRVTAHVVDTDIHEVTRTTADLLPYLEPQYHHLITEYGWHESRLSAAVHHFATPTPGRGMRVDSFPEDGSRPGSNLALMQRQLLDENAIDVGILNGLFHPASMHSWLEFADALARAYNDWQIATWLEPEPRLRGSVHFTTFDPERAVREIDRVGPHPQMVQAFLPVASDHGWGDPIYQPIFDAAARHGLVVAMHHNGQTKTALPHSRFWIEHHTLLGQSHMCQIVSLICSGVFERHPDLKVAVLEGGFSWLPYLMWRFDQQYLEFRSEVPWLKRKPSDYIRDNFRFATQPVDQLSTQHFLQLIDMMGSDRLLMYSSDYPHFDFDSPARVMPPGVPDELRERILWRNAAETYGLDLA
jgi:uncharacterized protein